MERPLTVGQLAHATCVPAKTIRYYEQVGVLPVPKRSGAGYRQYSRHDVHRLLFIRRVRLWLRRVAHAVNLLGRRLQAHRGPSKRTARAVLRRLGISSGRNVMKP
jgi:DNA-binding transcriptional MerR regulator